MTKRAIITAEQIEQADGPSRELDATCFQCSQPVFEDELCLECWNEINGQFGVGA